MTGGKIRMLNIVDEFTREALAGMSDLLGCDPAIAGITNYTTYPSFAPLWPI